MIFNEESENFLLIPCSISFFAQHMHENNIERLIERRNTVSYLVEEIWIRYRVCTRGNTRFHV